MGNFKADLQICINSKSWWKLYGGVQNLSVNSDLCFENLIKMQEFQLKYRSEERQPVS